MLIQSENIGIIADDLTGANDTALQFHLKGCNTQILFDYNSTPENLKSTMAWAISTETRNLNPKEAYNKVSSAAKSLMENLNAEYLYKKIDSTLRGNIAQETLAILDVLGWDAAIIAPAFPQEGRITVGGYHLLKGIPIERTEIARDPGSPIYESHIPSLLNSQLKESDIVSLVELNTIMKGAGPILMEMQNLIKEGKKLIVMDAVSTVDLEQIVLALQKSTYNILPTGSAGFAQALGDVWVPELEYQHISKTIPQMPVLMVSGSMTDITATQLQKTEDDDELDVYFLDIKSEFAFEEPTEEIIQRAIDNLKGDNIVTARFIDSENIEQKIKEHGLTKETFAPLTTDYLAKLTQKIVEKTQVILVFVGGETSYKCCNAINSSQLQLIDEVEPAIPLCLDHEARWLVTKSGNLGTPKTLVNILKYFKKFSD